MVSDDVDGTDAVAARYEALIRVSEALRAYRDRDALLRSLARELRPVVRFDFLGLGLYDEVSDSVEPFVLEASGELGPVPTLTSDDQLTLWVLRNRQPLVVPVIDDERRFSQEIDYLRGRGTRSACCLPLTTPHRQVGMLIAGSRVPHMYSESDVGFLTLIANQIALAIDATYHFGALQNALQSVEARAQDLEAEVDALGGHRRAIGDSPEWKSVLRQATQVAATSTTVLLVGESGTGKEVIARFIHRTSQRRDGPFVPINCAAVPDQLLESELFGYERGAFTGALRAKPGLIEQASGGVLFLDEISEMSPVAQAKLLRVLQEREFQRLGGTKTIRTDVRIVAATNRNLPDQIARGTFREDLYYRLNVFGIRLPPLRERRSDILPLSEAFLKDISSLVGRPPGGIAHEARDSLLAYRWPGNVRELRNVLERAAILCDGGLITSAHLALAPDRAPEPRGDPTLPRTADHEDASDLRSMERAAIERALVDSKHNKSAAAKKLGLSRKQLYVRLKQHGLT